MIDILIFITTAGRNIFETATTNQFGTISIVTEAATSVVRGMNGGHFKKRGRTTFDSRRIEYIILEPDVGLLSGALNALKNRFKNKIIQLL